MDFARSTSSTRHVLTAFIILCVLSSAICDKNDCPAFFNSQIRENRSINVTESNLIHCEAFNKLIDLLEDLTILTPRDISCYALQTVKQTFGEMREKSQTVTISLQFQENFKSTSGSDTHKNHVMCSTDKAPYQLQDNPQHSPQKDNKSDSNSTNTIFLATTTNNGDSSGLSHTQVVVIATCSAVIGTFFILAAALRIRNYCKRIREEQQAMRRSNNYRLPLAKGSNPGERHSSYRKSSTSSRESQQNSLLAKDGDTYASTNLPSACHQPLLMTTPQLIVTAPSTAASTPGDSHSSIQFIDEDVNNDVKENDEINDVKDVKQFTSTNKRKDENETERAQTKLNDENISNTIIASGKTDEPSSYVDEPSPQSMDDSIPMSISKSHSVSIGLTQSDDSLSSHNASYCYGNQSEYLNGGYGNIGYCPPVECEEIIDNDVIDETDIENNCVDFSKEEYDNDPEALPSNNHHHSLQFCENPTSFEKDEIKNRLQDTQSRPGLKDTYNIVSLDQYEQRRKLQRQDRTLTQTNSFDTDAF